MEKTEFFDLLDKLRDELQKNISVDKIIDNGKELEKYGINILNQNQEDKDFINILMSLYFKRGSLNFILKLTDDDCRHLQELVSESENTFLKGADIQDLIKCNNFINNLGDIEEATTDQELITILKNKVNETKNIAVHFIKYTNNWGQIKELFTQKLDRSQANLKQIKNIMKESTFTLSIKNSEDIYLNFIGKFIDDKNEGKNIHFENVIELRGRAMLTKKLADQTEEEKQIFEINKKFAERMNEIDKIYSLLRKIAEKGYSEDLEIKVEINEGKPNFLSKDNNLREYKD